MPVRQFVIYIGNSEPKMKTVLTEDGNYFQFQLINIIQFDYLRFLNSDNPEEIILAILSNFGKENPENALQQIIHRLEETTKELLTFKIYLRQLRVLSKLRKLDLKFDDMIQNMAKYIDAENDYLFIRGKKEAEERFVENLLNESNFTLDKIAKLSNVTIDFVISIQQKLSANK